MQQAIEIASQDPAKFQLTTTELDTRQSWVRDTRRQITSIQESVKATSSRSTISRQERQNDEFLSSQKLEQEMVIKRQDEELDHVEQAVTRIGDVGRTIHGELGSQHQLLNALNEDVETTDSRLRAAQIKIKEVMKRSGGTCQVCTIVGLSLLLLILIVVAAST